MARQMTEIEMARAAMLKAIRSTIRLKHSLAADEELNTVLPEAQAAFDKAVHLGQLPDAQTLTDIVKEVLDA